MDTSPALSHGPGIIFVGWIYQGENGTQFAQSGFQGYALSVAAGAFSVSASTPAGLIVSVPNALNLSPIAQFNLMNIIPLVANGAIGKVHTQGCFTAPWDGKETG